MVILTDGVTGTLSDQDIVDIVKEARTPEQAAKDVVGLAVLLVGHCASDGLWGALLW